MSFVCTRHSRGGGDLKNFLFTKISETAKNLRCSSVSFFLPPQEFQHCVDQSILFDSNDILILKKHQYIDTSSIDTIVNLQLTESDLWAKMRKSYKSLINSILKNPDFFIQIVDTQNPNEKIHDLYVSYHHICSGRKTRSDASFDIQFEMLKKGLATLFALSYKQHYIGFCYFLHYKQSVIYHSESDDPSYDGKGIAICHTLLWKAICHFKALGYHSISYSQPSNFYDLQGFEDYSDTKQNNIAHFKRGMCSTSVPIIRGKKYLSQNELKNDIALFQKKSYNLLE